MADTKLSALTAVSSLATADLLYVVQSGVSKKATMDDILTLMESTANTFTADQTFSLDSATALLVEDSSNNPLLTVDTSTMRVSINGADTMTVNGTAISSKFAVHADDGASNAEIEMHRHGATAAAGTSIYGARSRGSTGAETIVNDNDRLLTITAVGYDGTDYATSAQIQFNVDGTPASNQMGGEIVFLTAADGGQTLAAALTLGNDKVATFTGDVIIPSAKALSLGGAAVLNAQYEQIIPASSNTYSHWGNGTGGIFMSDPSSGAGIYNVVSYKSQSTNTAAQALIQIATINSATEDSGTTAIGEYRAYVDIGTPTSVTTRPLFAWKNATTAKLTLAANGDLTTTGDITMVDASVIQTVGSMSIDIDSNNDGSAETFTITHNGGGTTIASFSEGNQITFPDSNLLIGTSSSSTRGIELGDSSATGTTPYIDLNFGITGSEDYNIRLINSASGTLAISPQTYSGSILSWSGEAFKITNAASWISMVPPGSTQTQASVRFENQAATADASINPYQDASGTDVWLMSNCYLSTGTVTRYDTGEESSYVAVGRTGYIYFGTNTSAGNATTQFNIDPNGDMNVTSGNVIQGATTANFINLDSSNNLIVGTPDNNVIVSLDSDNSGTTSTFIVQADGSTARFSVTEDGNATVTSASTTTNSFVVTADSKTTGSIAQFNSNSADTNTRNLVKITNDNTLATGARGLFIQQDSSAAGIFIDHNLAGNAIEIDADDNSATAMYGMVMNLANAGAGLEYAFRFNGSEVVNAAVGGSQDYKIRISIGGTDYFIPCNTA